MKHGYFKKIIALYVMLNKNYKCPPHIIIMRYTNIVYLYGINYPSIIHQGCYKQLTHLHSSC